MNYICNDCGCECTANLAHRVCPKCGGAELIPVNIAECDADEASWNFNNDEHYDEG